MERTFNLGQLVEQSQAWFDSAHKANIWDRPREDLTAFIKIPAADRCGRALTAVCQLAAWSARKACTAIGSGACVEGWGEMKRFFDYEFWSFRTEINSFRPASGRFARTLNATLKPFHLSGLAAAFREWDSANWLGSLIIESRCGFPLGSWTTRRSFLRNYICELLARSMERDDYRDDLGAYVGIFASWDEPQGLAQAIMGMCDYHVERIETGDPDERGEFRSNPHDIFPSEILALYRVREKLGLETPWVQHPLLETPFAQVPEKITYEPDPLVVQAMDLVTKLLPEAVGKR
jgi:hypothetical protein